MVKIPNIYENSILVHSFNVLEPTLWAVKTPFLIVKAPCFMWFCINMAAVRLQLDSNPQDWGQKESFLLHGLSGNKRVSDCENIHSGTIGT